MAQSHWVGRQRADATTNPVDDVLQGYAGPAIWVAGDGRIGAVNAAGHVFLENGELQAALRPFPAQIRLTGEVLSEQLALTLGNEAAGPRRFDLMMLPHEGGTLILGRETTFEANLIRALKASRELFRDLALCSADFAFETDPSGALIWVSPKGALGYSALDLNGRQACSLLASEQDFNPFAIRAPIENEVVKLVSPALGTRICHVSAVPVISNVGAWRGVRGVARDVTELARAEAREAMTRAIVDALHSAVEPEEMLRRAARAVADGCQADAAWIVWGERGKRLRASATGAEPGQTCEDIASRIIADGGDAPVVLAADDWSGLGLAAQFRGRANGAILVARRCAEPLLEAEIIGLLRSIAPQIAIAIAQAETFHAMEALSRTDPLTGLMNRRGFEEAIAQRMAALARSGRNAALLYVDCDHFKAVNDCLGHGAGDQLLAAIGVLLRRETRKGDLLVRFGGDEFGLWLEEVSEDNALAKGEALARGFLQVSRGLALPLTVTPSIGIAFMQAGQETSLHLLMERADKALYAAKKAGRNRMGVSRALDPTSEPWVSPCLKPC